MKERKKTTQKGFTLIELMIVVLIMGILSGIMLAVINVPGIQSKARDAERVGDVKKIQTALELYFLDHRSYPYVALWSNVTPNLSNIISPASGTKYINSVPKDPKETTATPAGVSCFNGKTNYAFYYKTNAESPSGSGLAGRYVLGAIMEVVGSATDNLCSSMANCIGSTPAIDCNCASASPNCYFVENPL